MRKNFKILLMGVLALILVASAAAYMLLTPQYKQIELNGYKMEVPKSNAEISMINDNYRTYEDKENNITIKSYALINLNETNYTGAGDVGAQVGSNIGNNTTIENKTVLNQSGKYTYYDLTAYQMIVITADNYETMSHILKTLNKTDIHPNTENLTVNLTSLNNTNDTNNTTTTTKKTQSTTKKSSSTSKKSGSDTFYVSDPEGSGEYVGVGEGTYRKKSTGEVYVEYGRGNFKRRADLDNKVGY